VVIGFRPEHVHVGEAADRDALTFDGRVEVVEYLGNEKLVHIVRNEAPLVAMVPVEQPVEEGAEMTFTVPAQRIHRFDEATSAAIE
jgi:multiple sugar transport system ATP-binding protein